MTTDSSLGFAPCLYSEYSGYTESEPKTSFRHAFLSSCFYCFLFKRMFSIPTTTNSDPSLNNLTIFSRRRSLGPTEKSNTNDPPSVCASPSKIKAFRFYKRQKSKRWASWQPKNLGNIWSSIYSVDRSWNCYDVFQYILSIYFWFDKWFLAR
jgi:hypothetical protein